MIETTETLAMRMKAARKELSMSQDKLAELSSIPRNTIASIEAGNTRMTSNKCLTALAKPLRVTLHFLKYGGINMDTLDFEVRLIAITLQKMSTTDKNRNIPAIKAILSIPT